MIAAPSSNRPRYAPIAPFANARAHLLVCDQANFAGAVFADGHSADDFAERWVVAAQALVLPKTLGGPGEQQFRSASHLVALLRHRLAAETMGLRLYALGREPFVWDVARAGHEAGMGREEMQLQAFGPPVRRVSCVHCRTINHEVTTTLVICAGCGATLTVRDHFSRQHNTWMGVQCDAEAPGDVPPVEELSA